MEKAMADDKSTTGNSPVAVFPADERELQETCQNEEAEEQIEACSFKFRNGKQCEWYGSVRHMKIHWEEYHSKEEINAKGMMETKKAPSQHDTQLTPASSPSWSQDAIAGPSGVALLNPKESALHNPLKTGTSCSDYPTCTPKSDGDQSWHEAAQTLMHQQNIQHNALERLSQQLTSLSTKFQVLEQKQSQDRTDVVLIKQQLEALGHAVVTRKRDFEQLQDKFKALQNIHQSEQLQQQLAALDDTRATEAHQVKKLHEEVRKAVGQILLMEQQQSTDQNAVEQLKGQLAVFDDELAVEKRNNGRLRDELRTAQGKIQALEQELEAVKNSCACAQEECVAERERGMEAQALESDLLHVYIGNVQTRCANLEARFEDERLQGFNGDPL